MKFLPSIFCLVFPILSLALKLQCLPDQVYKTCETCEKTCSDPNPSCRGRSCMEGCFCKEGFFKSPDGMCVQLKDCPKAETNFNEPLSIEDCNSNEEYFSCGWCEATCSDPKPRCPAEMCTRGCLCRPPLLRHQGGQCVEEQFCAPYNCTATNEVYACRYGCERRCDGRQCRRRTRGCTLGCHCKLGLMRDRNEKCVNSMQC